MSTAAVKEEIPQDANEHCPVSETTFTLITIINDD